MSVEVKGSIDSAIRQLKMEAQSTLSKVREKESYKKPGVQRREAKKEGIKNSRRNAKKNNARSNYKTSYHNNSNNNRSVK